MTTSTDLSWQAKLLRLVLVLACIVGVLWTVGRFYVPWTIQSQGLAINAKLAPNAVFVTLRKLEEQSWKLDTDAVSMFIHQHMRRQGLADIEHVRVYTPTGAQRAAQKQEVISASDGARTASSDSAILTFSDFKTRYADRQQLILQADEVRAGRRSGDLKNVTWSVELHEGDKTVWSATIERSSNGLLDSLRDGYKLLGLLQSSGKSGDELMADSDWAQMSQALWSQMQKDGLIAVR
jgi:hypothetical protein